MEWICLPPRMAQELWPSVSPLIYAAMVRGGLTNFSIVESAVHDGQMLLRLVVDAKAVILAAVVTEISLIEGVKYGTIVACGGKQLSSFVHLRERLYDYFREEGCSKTRLLGRPGWSRLLRDYTVKAVVMEREL